MRKFCHDGRYARILFGISLTAGGLSEHQLDLRSKMRPSLIGNLGAFRVELLSNQPGSVSDGFLGSLNKPKSGSSSGIHSLIACQDGLMDAIFRIIWSRCSSNRWFD